MLYLHPPQSQIHSPQTLLYLQRPLQPITTPPQRPNEALSAESALQTHLLLGRTAQSGLWTVPTLSWKDFNIRRQARPFFQCSLLTQSYQYSINKREKKIIIVFNLNFIHKLQKTKNYLQLWQCCTQFLVG